MCSPYPGARRQPTPEDYRAKLIHDRDYLSDRLIAVLKELEALDDGDERSQTGRLPDEHGAI